MLLGAGAGGGDGDGGTNIRGNILGVAIELTPSVSFEFGQENNNTMDAKSYGKLTVKLPLVIRCWCWWW
jgi:hypothetical protein